MNKILGFFGWLAFSCGVLTYLIAWVALSTQSSVWGIAPEFWFYDAISAVLIGIFLMIVVKR